MARHPSDDRLSGIYGTILYDELGPLHQRNVTVFADGEVDRSPCGSGTSARLALLDLEPGEVLRTTRSSGRRSPPGSSSDADEASSPRSRARRSVPASTASCSTRATSSAPGSCCGEPAVPRPRASVRRGGRRLEAALAGGLDPEPQPPRTSVPVGDGELLVMPAAVGPVAAVKLVTVGPAEPRIQGVCVVFDAATLAPVALVDGIALTNLRTAAVSLVAVRRLAAPDARRLVVFGRGPQARAHADARWRWRTSRCSAATTPRD